MAFRGSFSERKPRIKFSRREVQNTVEKGTANTVVVRIGGIILKSSCYFRCCSLHLCFMEICFPGGYQSPDDEEKIANSVLFTYWFFKWMIRISEEKLLYLSFAPYLVTVAYFSFLKKKKKK